MCSVVIRLQIPNHFRQTTKATADLCRRGMNSVEVFRTIAREHNLPSGSPASTVFDQVMSRAERSAVQVVETIVESGVPARRITFRFVRMYDQDSLVHFFIKHQERQGGRRLRRAVSRAIRDARRREA